MWVGEGSVWNKHLFLEKLSSIFHSEHKLWTNCALYIHFSGVNKCVVILLYNKQAAVI